MWWRFSYYHEGLLKESAECFRKSLELLPEELRKDGQYNPLVRFTPVTFMLVHTYPVEFANNVLQRSSRSGFIAIVVTSIRIPQQPLQRPRNAVPPPRYRLRSDNFFCFPFCFDLIGCSQESTRSLYRHARKRCDCTRAGRPCSCVAWAQCTTPSPALKRPSKFSLWYRGCFFRQTHKREV